MKDCMLCMTDVKLLDSSISVPTVTMIDGFNQVDFKTSKLNIPLQRIRINTSIWANVHLPTPPITQ